jgi:protein-tyrosine phosphatase
VTAGTAEAGSEAARCTVLVLCTGNVCRSPAAELLLGARLRGAHVQVASAGTRALAGAPVHEPMAELLRSTGIDAGPFTARMLRPEHLRGADLVLAMSREHRAAAVALVPAVVRRTFLLGEAGVIGAAIAADGWPDDVSPEPAARLAALPVLAPRYRRPGGTADLEVPDPYRRAPEAYRASFALIEESVDRLARAVA